MAGVEAHPTAAQRARPRVDLLVEGDLLTAPLPFRSGEFHTLIFADVLEHLPDPLAALRRYLPYLAPEGDVIVSVPNFRFFLVLWRLALDRWAYTESGVRDRTHLRIFTRRSLLTLLEAAGLRPVRVESNYRLFEDKDRLGRTGALLNRAIVAWVAPYFLSDLWTYQYRVLSLRSRAD